MHLPAKITEQFLSSSHSTAEQIFVRCARRLQASERGSAAFGAGMSESASSSAWASTLAQLEAQTPQHRSDALDQVTELLQQNDWQLPAGLAAQLIAALRERLTDDGWCAAPPRGSPRPAPLAPMPRRPPFAGLGGRRGASALAGWVLGGRATRRGAPRPPPSRA